MFSLTETGEMWYNIGAVQYSAEQRGKKDMKYWLVICYVGHCGRRHAPREIGLAIKAKDSVDALLQAKKFPGVKHHKSRYICTTREITEEEYLERRQESAYIKALR